MSEWPVIGGNNAGQRYSKLTDITPSNVAKLKLAWSFHSGDISTGTARYGASALEVTPLEIGGTLYFCTPFNRIIALDAETGVQKWRFDPQVHLDGVYTPVCRGVSYWRDETAASNSPCAERLFMGTLDARLVAVDARTGKACRDFGRAGFVNLLDNLGDVRAGEYYPTSPPQVVGDKVAIGAFIKDGQRLDAPGGAVRAFSARSGELIWVWDPVPPGSPAVTAAQAKQGAILTRGTPNVWALMSADPAQHLIYLPTGNPAPDHYAGAERAGKDYYGSSVVALDSDTGALRWSFQTVHHDLWDYDVAAQPVLFERGGLPTVVAATKVGMLFLLNAQTGTPLFPVEERPVPASTVPGEHSAPTQPFPSLPAPVHPLALLREDIWGALPWDKSACQALYDSLQYRGVFTPPSLQGSLDYPGLGGGINWGSVSIDPVKNRMLVNFQIAPFTIKLAPRPAGGKEGAGGDLVGSNPQEGTPYIAERGVFLAPSGRPCVPPPWGRLRMIDLNTGATLWERPLGNLHGLAFGIGRFLEWGTPNSGGSLQTAGGLIFIGATMDKYFRAFDADTGDELWRIELPFAAHATPLTYRARAGGKQFIVIAAGGHAALGTTPGDALLAFTLDD